MIHELVLHVASVEPHTDQESNRSDSGKVRLLKPAIIHTHSHRGDVRGFFRSLLLFTHSGCYLVMHMKTIVIVIAREVGMNV